MDIPTRCILKKRSSSGRENLSRRMRRRLRNWQYSRSWARLILEVEKLWQVDSRELKRIGALELTQLLNEVPPAIRQRVNYWLSKYQVGNKSKRYF